MLEVTITLFMQWSNKHFVVNVFGGLTRCGTMRTLTCRWLDLKRDFQIMLFATSSGSLPLVIFLIMWNLENEKNERFKILVGMSRLEVLCKFNLRNINKIGFLFQPMKSSHFLE